MDRRSMIFQSVKVVGLGLLMPSIIQAKSSNSIYLQERDRTETLIDTLEIATNKVYDQITDEDLEQLSSLSLSHIHIESFRPGDFKGLSNLKTLDIISIFHNKQGCLSAETFSSLGSLETLKIIGNQFTRELHDDAFAPLETLKILDLRGSKFLKIPLSILTSLPSLEQILISGISFNEVDKTTLKDHFKEKLSIS